MLPDKQYMYYDIFTFTSGWFDMHSFCFQMGFKKRRCEIQISVEKQTEKKTAKTVC